MTREQSLRVIPGEPTGSGLWPARWQAPRSGGEGTGSRSADAWFGISFPSAAHAAPAGNDKGGEWRA
jgi:hypothetical protein